MVMSVTPSQTYVSVLFCEDEVRHCEFLMAPVRLVKAITHNIADKRHLDSTVTTSNLAALRSRQHFWQ
jgi:hypothetical protein